MSKVKEPEEQASFTVKLVQVSPQEWVAKLYQDNKIVKTTEPTLYNGVVAHASQYLLRAPYGN